MKKILLLLLLFPISLMAQLNQMSRADKLYGLSKFWQEVNYNFVYLNKVDRPKWDSTYKALLNTIADTKDDYEYYRELQRFCAMLKDGHTNIYMPEGKAFEQMTSMFGEYRLGIQDIDGKAIIVRVNLSKKNEIPLGTEIIEVNGKSTQEYLQEYVIPYIASSTDYVLREQAIRTLLSGREGDTYKIKIRKPKGDVSSLTLTHKLTEEKEVYPAFPEESQLLDFKWYDKGVAYLALNSFGDRKIDTLFTKILPELYKAKSLIIDLRNNGGGSTDIGTYILNYLTNDTLLYGSKSSTRQHTAAYKAWGKFLSAKDTINNKRLKTRFLSYQDNYFFDFDYGPSSNKIAAKRIVIPTVILIGHNTASAAEDFLIYADKQKHMKKIGQNTYGSTGQPYLFDLPGGGSARVCTKKDTYPDGREFVGYGIKPDMEVVPTLKDYLDKKDPVLDKALNYLRK
jgi:C-terminal processing protease CtpA/Prc